MKPSRVLQLFILLCGLDPVCTALPQHLGADTAPHIIKAGRPLKGRFLHITDIHPDPFYKTYSSTVGEHACHRGKGPAGYYGAETSDCDAPISLLNATFQWINETIRDEIDFIIWTGDSARHDNDERIPRNEKQVISQNELVVQKFLEVFGKPENLDDPDPTNDFTIPIVPTLGNNDILPHNIFLEGPNKWTKTFVDVWRQFIPEEQRHQFVRGGWFYVEVIPNQLAVISLNTMYFFVSNSAVDGCAAKSEPGYEHFEWLRIQLGILRDRGMKALLIGHVPPARVDSKMSWDETCWQKYTLWQKQYRDVIIGSFFGHMNIDHFILQDFKEIKKGFKKGRAPAKMHGPTAKYAADEELSVMSATDYLIDLRDYFSKIPSISGKLQTADEDEQETSWLDGFMSLLKKNKKNKGKKGKKKHSKKPQNPLRKIGGEYGERYGLSFVQASIVPNFFPTLRVFEYNITGLEGLDVASSPSPGLSDSKKTLGAYPKQSPILSSEMKPLFMDEFTEDIALPSLKASNPVDDQKKKKKKKKKYKFKVPKAPSKATPPGPAYSPQTLSLLGYTQYFANITHINNDFLNTAEEEGVGEEKWKEGKHKGKSKKGKPHPKKFKFEVEYDTFSDKIFGLKDLTVRSYIDLAAVIGESQSALQSAYEVEDIEQASEAEDGASASKKGKKKKNKKKPKESKSSKVWHTFIKRAFVGTIDPEELEKRFLAWNASPSQAGNASEGGSLEL